MKNIITTICRGGGRRSLVCFLAMAMTLLSAKVANAAASAKAIVYNDGRIVYYYDDIDHSSDVGFVQSIAPTQTSAKSPSVTVTSIVIDSSYADFKPTSLAYYFGSSGIGMGLFMPPSERLALCLWSSERCCWATESVCWSRTA